MTCKLYSKAETAARDAVIQALHDNVDQATLGKLWDAYLGLRDVSENHTHEDDITITTPDNTGETFVTFGETNIGDINLDFTPEDNLKDVLTFNTGESGTSTFNVETGVYTTDEETV